ncbi:AMP-binding protein [Chelativorans sp. ZYF759]|uniref:AMP-binding protein n=1 Tax=Chelativorans sp. ZYF759 TaxID=2692213 RepID=UPI00145EFC01|nr:AMP-binding protein [Chelativorans sp. ZYF759]NMG41661.1 AMP-binding protein [Chelativorans sp. ZYF759]
MRLEPHLRPRAANHVPLTPVELLVRTAEIYPDRSAVVWNGRSWTYSAFARMVTRFASFLAAQGVDSGDVVSVMASNRAEMLAAHYAVPMLGAVLNTINTRLDQDTVRYILAHSQSRLFIVDGTCGEVALAAAAQVDVPVYRLVDPAAPSPDGLTSALDLLSDDGAAARLDLSAIVDEWQPICINYTSGTTGRPKGVMYTHRGAYLNALGNVLALGLTTRSVYLWTLPMFHCNGWCHTWAVTAAGGLHVCLDGPDPALIFPAIEAHGVTHLACAPVVLYMMLNHPARESRNPSRRIMVATGGAAPTNTLIAQLDVLGFDLTHLYGLTESYGPSTLRELTDEERTLPPERIAVELAQQGVRHVTANRVRVVDETGADVPMDGASLGEIVLAGNTLMAGYYQDAETTEKAFEGGVFHTGDLAVRHPDGNIEIRDRSKDIIISGGENVSSLEVESVLHGHPAVLLAAVVAAPHDKWGETPVAFLELRDGATATPEELRAYCREHLAGYKVPSQFRFIELPKTATGKIQKFVLREQARSPDTGASRL